jgi:hypothetical protein
VPQLKARAESQRLSGDLRHLSGRRAGRARPRPAPGTTGRLGASSRLPCWRRVFGG